MDGSSRFQSTRPVQDATRRIRRSLHRPRSFNPRARTGRDLHCINAATVQMTFQSTRPYRARHTGTGTGDKDLTVSIHAPVQGATAGQVGAIDHLPVSIHAPVQGATAQASARRKGISGFNPRARTGRDSPGGRSPSETKTFQSTRPYRARRLSTKRKTA